jgi:hypothetical protein
MSGPGHHGNTRRQTAHVPGLILAVIASVASAQTTDTSDKWTYEVMPYLWAAGINGREGVDGVTANLSMTAKDLIDFVNIGASARVTGNKGPCGWYGELSYVGIQDDVQIPRIGAARARAKSSQTPGELGADLEVLSGLGLSVYAGLRYQEKNAIFEAAGLRRETDHSWADGIAGVKWEPLRLEHWSAWARADIGSGGSNFVWLAEVGGGWWRFPLGLTLVRVSGLSCARHRLRPRRLSVRRKAQRPAARIWGQILL